MKPLLRPRPPGREVTGGTWTGWIEADLFSCSDSADRPAAAVPAGAIAVTCVEIAVRLDVVTFWIGARALAVADRDVLRAWAASPVQPLRVDDVEFVLVEGQLCLRIDGAGPFVLGSEAVRLLIEVLQP
jgi:hypothetical protein